MVQEVARVLWQKFEEFDRAKPFLPWAQKVTYCEVLKQRRSSATHRRYFSDRVMEQLAEEDAGDAELLEAQRVALEGCLAGIGQMDRDLIVRRYTGEQAVAQIAREFGKSPNAISMLLHRIRQQLIECVDRTLSSEGWR